MRVINFSEARNNLKSILDQVTDDADYTVISRRDSEDAIVMSLDTFNSLMETFHLLKTPANADHLMKSIQQFQNNQTKERELINE
jgi:antitoxin YefM